MLPRRTASGINEYLSKIFTSFILDDLTFTQTNMIVNVYGDKDILGQLKIDGQAIGGYRDSLAGFRPNASSKALFNIEIAGATHFDYMRRGEEDFNMADTQWNNTVADFVTNLVLNSQDSDSINLFLETQVLQGRASKRSDKWVITLPGWQSR